MTARATASPPRKEQILAAAERLFLTYGMRRTSMDDIAEAVGLAKGTLYLSFRSKQQVFAALARRMVDQFRARALAASGAEADLTAKLAAYLDEAIGAPGRLLATTPHTVEILDAKRDIAAGVLRDYESAVLSDLAGIAGYTGDLPRLLVEAAHGCKATGLLDSPDYRARLARHVAVLLKGVG